MVGWLVGWLDSWLNGWLVGVVSCSSLVLLLASCSPTSLTQHDHEVKPLVFHIW